MVEPLAEAVDRHRVVIVTAPSGYGKSTAVAEWAARSADRTAWLSLGRGDADPIRLAALVLEALQSLALRLDDPDLLELLAVDAATTRPDVVTQAVRAALDRTGERIHLVVDDAQRGGDELAAGIVGDLVDVAPDSLRMVLVGTSVPGAAFARWSLTHPEAVIGADLLQFDEAEVADLGRSAGGDIDPRTVLADTGGWPIAVRFVLLTGARPTASVAGSGLILRDYVDGQVLAALPAEWRAIVYDTAICDELSPALARAVTGRDDAPEVLDELLRRGLFLSRIDAPGGALYRWHPVFAREAAAVARAADAGAAARAHRAAAAFLAPTDPVAAVAHLVAVDDIEAAIGVIERSWVRMVIGTDAAAVDRLCSTLPAWAATDPRLLLIRACALDVMGQRSVARMLAEQAARTADAALEGYPRIHALARLFLDDERAVGHSATTEARAVLGAGDGVPGDEMAAVLYLLGWAELRHRTSPRLAVELLEAAVRKAEQAGDESLARRAAGHLAFVSAWSGRFAEARALLTGRGGPDDDASPWRSYAGGSVAAAAAYVAYFADDHTAVVVEALRAIDSGSSDTSFAGVARLVLALSAAATKDPEACRRAAAELAALPERETQGVSWPAFRAVAAAMLDEAAGRRPRALAIARRLPGAESLPLVSVELAGLLRRAGEYDEAHALLGRLRGYEGISYVRAATLIAAAVVQQRAGAGARAHETLERALDTAAAETVRRPLRDGDPAVRALLVEHLSRGTRHEEFVASCLADARSGGPADRLSEREHAVLDLLRTPKTVAEIAAALGVSVNTVKTHQRAVYRKLGVGSRREALRLLA